MQKQDKSYSHLNLDSDERKISELQWRITAFFDWWRKRHAFVSNLNLAEHSYEGNVLLWTYFDALSNIWAESIGKKECSNSHKRKIFNAFLARYGGDVFQLVSLPDVWSRIKRGEASKLPENVSIFLSNIGVRKISSTIYMYEDNFGMDDYTTRSILNDLSLDDIINQTISNCPNTTSSELNQWLILSQYGAIAYKEMRCSYIHEGRPGKNTHGYKLDGWAEKPTYLSSVYATPPKMGFSVEFMLGVLKHCIEKFEAEALALQVDPVRD
jgi:hypothetical protein